MRWIILHGTDTNSIDRDSDYYVQVSHISYVVSRPHNNTRVCFAGDNQDWITVKEMPEHIFDMILENDENE